MMGIAFWVGLFWRRATVAAAWISTLTAFLAMIVTGRLGPNQLPEFMLYNGAIYLPYQMVIYLMVGLITMIVVSLFTKRC